MAKEVSTMVCEAHAKGYKPVRILWSEVCRTVRCTPSQFSCALSDNPPDLPSIRRIRAETRRILDQAEDICRETFRCRCAHQGITVDEVYRIYAAEHPANPITPEQFRQSASDPYTTSDYHVAKAADAILERLGKEKRRRKS